MNTTTVNNNVEKCNTRISPKDKIIASKILSLWIELAVWSMKRKANPYITLPERADFLTLLEIWSLNQIESSIIKLRDKKHGISHPKERRLILSNYQWLLLDITGYVTRKNTPSSLELEEVISLDHLGSRNRVNFLIEENKFQDRK